jgi:hypothetical protein
MECKRISTYIQAAFCGRYQGDSHGGISCPEPGRDSRGHGSGNLSSSDKISSVTDCSAKRDYSKWVKEKEIRMHD